MKRLCLVSLVSAAALPLVSCAGGEGGGAAFTERDSAGVTIVENVRGSWSEAQSWRLSPEPAVDIGVLEGAPEYQLFRVGGALRLDDGRIVVANGGTGELRFYDEAGSYLSASGRKGEGPGEFKRPVGIAAARDGACRGFESLLRYCMSLNHLQVVGALSSPAYQSHW